MSDPLNPLTFTAPDIEEVEALFPSYEIHGLIACGGMGAVYHANQKSLDRPVGIKLLPRELSADEAFRVGFQAEAKAMAKLNHPNLVGVYDFGEAEGMLYIIMEFVPGSSLFEAANGEPVEQSGVIRIINAVCLGLANAHENGILHRDIKPANILLDVNLTPKVSDFGLASGMQTKVKEGEQIFGTQGYTAPEVINPPFLFDHRADIFSVGVMIYELLTGKILEEDSPPASKVCPCSPRFDRVIQRATNPDPNKRYNSTTELAEELQSIGKSAAKSLVTAGTKSGRPIRRPLPPPKLTTSSSSSGAGTLLLFLALLGACVFAYYQLKVKSSSLDIKKPVDLFETKQTDRQLERLQTR